MSKIHILINIAILILYSQCLDNSTLSNYKDIELKELKGIFIIDFDKEIIHGALNYTFLAKTNGTSIYLDARNLNIISITKKEDSGIKELDYNYGSPHHLYGKPLVITCDFIENEEIEINIEYETTKNGSSAQFLKKEQTVGKEYPVLLTLSEMTLGRELLPSQDTPAVKFPFYLGIKVKNPMRGMISGLFSKSEEDKENNSTIYYYNQSIPVPNYLIALAAGDIAEKIIKDKVSVYAEPKILDKCAEELDEMPNVLEIAIENNGPYEWGKYNILILPASFPYSAMENPCLTFASSCLINGDKSLFDIFVHELTHSWSGNLVTNENWRDFWLNEGITKYRQRQIVAKWKKEEDYPKMDAILGLYHIEEALDYLGRDSNATCLRPNLDNVVPDDIYSDIPYEKGYNFMLYVEKIVTREIMDEFFLSYFQEYKYKSVDLFDFKNYFEKFCREKDISNETLNSIDWDTWIYGAGPCPVPNDLNNTYLTQVNEEYEKFINGQIDEEFANTFNNWMHTSKTVFFLKLEKRDIFLTDPQHDFFTKTLKLYQNQNFLVTTYYFRLILGLTDKFYENEKESLIKYLKSYGVSDFMYGIYELFYRRDEEAAVKTLEDCSSFYHSIMYNKAKNDIERAKKTFPIMNVDLKSSNNEQCIILPEVNEFDIVSEEYNDTLGNIEIKDGIELKKDEQNVELNCFMNSTSKFCEFKNIDIINEGKYNLEIKERIQKKKYAIKKQTGVKKMQIYKGDKILKINETETKNDYKIDYKEQSNETIKIVFSQIPSEAHVFCGDKEIQCKLESKLECLITKEILNVDQNKPTEYKKYELNIMDACNNKKFTINVSVKEGESSKNNSWIYVIIGVFGFIFVALIVFFIIRAIKRKNNVNEIETNETGDTLIK